jgi:cytochrome b6-f complex iron-sulfur subunit
MQETMTSNMETETIEKKEVNTIDRNTIDRKEFMRQVGLSFGAIMLMNCLQSCGDVSEIPDPNPTGTTGKLDFTININDATYSSLKTKGNAVVVKAQNVIIARVNDTNGTWIAVDSRCTHEQTTINYRASSNDFLCPLHGSTFSATGAVTKSPANAALTRFNTSFDATNNTLRVFA